jgi:hypothetical protein
MRQKTNAAAQWRPVDIAQYDRQMKSARPLQQQS